MARFADLDSALIEQAGAWYALSHSDSVTGDELDALEVWLAADPRHEHAFALAVQLQKELHDVPFLNDIASAAMSARSGGVGGEVVSLDVARNAQEFGSETRPAANNDEWSASATASGWRQFIRKPAFRWGGMAAIAASLALMVSVGVFEGSPTGLPVSTAIAQTRVLTLADGSRVTLGPASRIAAQIDAKGRHVTLLSGEAFFEVAHDSSRPFWVQAGETKIQVVGTKFDVNRASGRVLVSVLQGVVKVHEPSALFSTGAVRTLRANEKVETADNAGSMFSAPPSTPILTDQVPAGDWRTGRRVYADARLGDVIADLNRYYAPGMKVTDPELSDVRVAVIIDPSNVDELLDVLPSAAPVRVKKAADGTMMIERVR